MVEKTKKRQNKHLDPMFRKRIISEHPNNPPKPGQTWVEYCKSLKIALPKGSNKDLKGIYA